MEVESARLAFKRYETVMEDPPDADEEDPAGAQSEQTEELAAAETGNEVVALDQGGDDEAEPPEDAFDEPRVQRVHLYRAGVDGRFVADALIFLRARRAGFLRSACGAGWLTFLLLVGGLVYLDDMAASTNSQTAAALLLLGPTLLAGSLIRPGEHRMAASVLVGVRLLLVAGIAATVLAVWLLAGAAACLRDELWTGATVLAGLAALGLTVSYLLPRATEA